MAGAMDILDKTVILRWMEGSKITAVTWCYNSLIIGNDAGELYCFQSADVERTVCPNLYKFAKVSNKTIANICPLEPKQWLLVLNAEGDLYTVNAFFNGQPSILRKKVTCMTRQTIEEYGDHGDNSIPPLPLSYGNCFCVATESNLYIYTCEGDKLKLLRRIKVDGSPLTAAWLNDIIVVGTQEVYYAMNPEGSVCHELCTNPRVDCDDGYPSGIMTTACVDKDIMVVCENIGIFYNTETVNLSKKNTIHWNNTLEALGCVPPYIIGVTTDKLVEIFGIRDQLPYQTINHANLKFVHYMPHSMAMLIATPNVVVSFRPKGYYKDISSAFDAKDLKRALHMVDLHFSPEHPNKTEQLKIAHTIAGWVRFSDMSFPLAFHHFTMGDVDIVHLLSFWVHYANLDVPDDYMRNANVPVQLRKHIPDAVPIREFIEKRFDELQCTLHSRATVSKLLELVSTSFATYLLQYFDLRILEQRDKIADPTFRKRLLGALEKTSLLLLAEGDDPRYNAIINWANEDSFLDVEECGKSLIEMGKGEVYAKMLVKKERYKEAMGIMADCIRTKKSSESTEDNSLKIRAICCEFASCLNILIRNSQGGYADQKDSSIPMEEIHKILNAYLPILLGSYPHAALDVLTKNHAILPFKTDEIMEMIDRHSPKTTGASRTDLHVKYLEDLVITNKHGSAYENTLLATHYMNELIAQRKYRGSSKDDNASTMKNTLVNLLESKNDFDIQQLGRLIAKLDIVEVTVLEHNKYNQHEAALRTLFERWSEKDKLKVCEAYCLCFGEIRLTANAGMKSTTHKRFFSNLEYWMDRAQEWPLKNHEIYEVGDSACSIDKLLSYLFRIIVEKSKHEEGCIYMARDLLSKYMPFCTHSSELNCSKILELIPDEWNFSVFANVIAQMQLKALHEERTAAMMRGLTRSVHNRTSKQLYQLTCVPPTTIDANSVCAICQEPIKLGMSIALPPPKPRDVALQQEPMQAVIMHEQCAKNVHDK